MNSVKLKSETTKCYKSKLSTKKFTYDKFIFIRIVVAEWEIFERENPFNYSFIIATDFSYRVSGWNILRFPLLYRLKNKPKRFTTNTFSKVVINQKNPTRKGCWSVLISAVAYVKHYLEKTFLRCYIALLTNLTSLNTKMPEQREK